MLGPRDTKGYVSNLISSCLCSADHCVSEDTDLQQLSIGQRGVVTVAAYGVGAHCSAVQVQGFPSANRCPHITLGLSAQAKAVCSNRIQEWTTLEPECQLRLHGVVRERLLS